MQREIGRLRASEEVVEFLVRKGIHKALGARPMKRTVQKFIGDAIRFVLKEGEEPGGVRGFR